MSEAGLLQPEGVLDIDRFLYGGLRQFDHHSLSRDARSSHTLAASSKIHEACRQ